jgi:4-hydroxythreonine-4-phosphate dehydrogenase
MGRESAECGRAAAEYIETAVALLRTGDIDAMTTAPINKHSLFLGGSSFPGHTEFLAHLAGSDNVAMAFFAPELRVALLTTHLALSEVSSRVRKAELKKLIRLVHLELRRYGVDQPRIAMAGLNPHAGEGGLFGSERRAKLFRRSTNAAERESMSLVHIRPIRSFCAPHAESLTLSSPAITIRGW